jgi:RNA polymerase sigma factor (sigma-70 family)
MRRGVQEDLLRALVPQVLGTLLRAYGPEQFDVCEDAVQEAVVQALQQWPTRPPRDPRAWLVTAARRRVVDEMRSERARRAREQVAGLFPPSDGPAPYIDDSLDVLALCCHPALTPTAQVVLTLRAVAGLTTAQISHALLIPDSRAANLARQSHDPCRWRNFSISRQSGITHRLDSQGHLSDLHRGAHRHGWRHA